MSETMWPSVTADCFMGDHFWYGRGICSSCGARLRCDMCGQFMRADKIEDHIQVCAVIEAQYQAEIDDMRARIY